MTEYEVTYVDVVPKDKQAVTTRKVEVDRHHEVRSNTAPSPPPARPMKSNQINFRRGF